MAKQVLPFSILISTQRSAGILCVSPLAERTIPEHPITYTSACHPLREIMTSLIYEEKRTAIAT